MTSNRHRKPVGQVPVPLFIFSAVSLLLGFMTELLGVFDGANDSLQTSWEASGFVFRKVSGLPEGIGVLVVALASAGVCNSILASPGDGRRVVLGISALILAMAFLPAFAVWGVFWKPCGMTLAVFWSWISSFLYARSHLMPCEMMPAETVENVIPLSGAQAAKQHSDHSIRADG